MQVLKDNYQASYTCDQIIENYKDFPEIVAEAKEVKKSIEYFLIDTKVITEAQAYGKKLRSFDTKSELEKCIFTLISK